MSSPTRSGKRPGRTPSGRAGRAPRRDLGDVLHFFIDEEEQRAALESDVRPSEPRPEPPRVPSPVVRWCMPANPDRLLGCALALDLAATLSRAGAPTRLLASFAAPGFLCAPPRVQWQHAQDPSRLAENLTGLEGHHVLVLLPAESIARALGGMRAASLDGVLLPVDANSRGLSGALNWLARHGNALADLRIGVVMIGGADAQQADAQYRKLAGAAKRQLELSLENLGQLRRDQTLDRSLLLGVPVLDVDAAGEASKSLVALAERLQ